MKRIRFLFTVLLMFSYLMIWAQHSRVDIKTFVTRVYPHGIPYEDAKAYGPESLPILFAMLNSTQYEDFRHNIISTIGKIGDASAIKPLVNFLYQQKGEIDYTTFVSDLAVFQALGFIAQSGNREALQLLIQWSEPNHFMKSGLNISFQSYKGNALGNLFRKIAIQGLGISGRQEALQQLELLSNPLSGKYDPKLENDLKNAVKLNKKVKTEGAPKAFKKEGSK